MIETPVKSNLGMILENLLEYTNNIYRNQDVCVAYKRPTPVKITKTRRSIGPYGQNGTQVIGYLEKKSTVDYDGIYKGYRLDFEAKTSNDDHLFPLSNIEEHQIEHLRQSARHGSITFFVFFLQKHDEFYLVPASFVIERWDVGKKARMHAAGTKSIQFDDIRANGYKLAGEAGVPLHYLPAVDELIKLNTYVRGCENDG